MIELKIYVPRPGTPMRHLIKAGSGIVGISTESGRILIDYEGAIYSSQSVSFQDKVFHAASRHITRYPTIARASLEPGDLIEVGIFRCQDDWKNPVCEITNQEALDLWLGREAGKP